MNIFKYLPLFFCLTAAAGFPGDQPGGIGVVLDEEGPYIVVKRILPDSPAAAQNALRVGDKITAVAQDKEPAVQVHGGELDHALHLIRGLRGTTVRLSVVSAGQDDSRARVVSLVRGEVKELSRWGDGVLLSKDVKAPDIKMLGLANGKLEQLSDYAGKIVVLEFWTAGSLPCQSKMATLQTYPAKYPDWKGKVILIAASGDADREAPAKLLKAKGWDQTHNVWVETDAIKACHIDVVPTVYIIDRQGKIVAANPANVPEIVNRELQPGTGGK